MAEMQQQMESSSTGSARTPQQQNEHAVPKAVERPDKEAAVEEALRAITRALQQHSMSPGGQIPISGGPENSNTKALALPTSAQQAIQGPAAFAKMNLAEVLRSAQTHVSQHASWGMASGAPPTDAPDSGMASLEDRITVLQTAAKAMEEARIARTAEARAIEQKLVRLRGEVAAKRAKSEVKAQAEAEEAHAAAHAMAEEANAVRAAEEATAAAEAQAARDYHVTEESTAPRAAQELAALEAKLAELAEVAPAARHAEEACAAEEATAAAEAQAALEGAELAALETSQGGDVSSEWTAQEREARAAGMSPAKRARLA